MKSYQASFPTTINQKSTIRRKLKKKENPQTLEAKNMLVNNQCVNEEIKEEIKKYLETNENVNTTFQNLWDTVKAILRGKFIEIQAYLNKQGKSQTI